jgi:hypothetical protein
MGIATTALACFLVLSTSPATGQKKQNPSPQGSDISREVRGPSETVTIINNSPAPDKRQETKNEAGGWPPISDIYWPTVALVLVTGIAVWSAVKTLGAIRQQVAEMQKTGEQTDALIAENISQSKFLRQQAEALGKSAYHLGESVSEAGRTARAMENVAEQIAVSARAAVDSVDALRERTAQQMRAYVTVNIGSATYQERAKGFRFEGKPLLINTGHTPARNVSFMANAAILEAPLPDDFGFPITTEIRSTATVGAGQNAVLSAIVDGFVDDTEVEDIKVGKARRVLFVWGIVTYDDIFGENHYTKFCQTLLWQPDGKAVFGFYYPKHNEAN